MKITNGLIRFAALLFLLWIPQSGICRIATSDTIRAQSFSFDILPEIERDLKICDLVKQENKLLLEKTVVQASQVIQAKSETGAILKQAKKDRRKVKFINGLRTAGEVIGALLLFKILS